MINALMTGLGIGLALWIVAIPSLMIVFRNSRHKVHSEANELNKKSLALLEERNELTKETNSHLDQIKIALWNLLEAQLRDKQ